MADAGEWYEIEDWDGERWWCSSSRWQGEHGLKMALMLAASHGNRARVVRVRGEVVEEFGGGEGA